ncbi:CotH kinase family protein [Candidatus Saccharibacteria bacterium]|nr:CotH kinase family protein [Candidatus Saccharibacteria bacterium]
MIETADFLEIRDRETELPAKLQIWGENYPESEVMNLTIRGRGNSSWTDMPKKSYKIEFIDKQPILGMPKDRDWALIANYADKTLMKNYLAYHLSVKFNAYYAPRCEFIELFLNRQYIGVYLLTETIKISKDRINMKTKDHTLLNLTKKIRNDEQMLKSYIISNDSIGKVFHIHYPKNASNQAIQTLDDYIHSFETFLKNIQNYEDNYITKWIDINKFVKHYWVQEFAKNPDACYFSSVYFSWEKDNVLKMGPVWDFDIAFGGHSNESLIYPEGWFIKGCYWNRYVFNDSIAAITRLKFWFTNRDVFIKTLDVIDSLYNTLKYASKNNFKKWSILNSTSYEFHKKAYQSYEESIQDLKNWTKTRFEWIDANIKQSLNNKLFLRKTLGTTF